MTSRRQKLFRTLDALDSRLIPLEDEILSMRTMIREIRDVVVRTDRRFQEHESHVLDGVSRLGERVRALELGRKIAPNGSE